MAQRTVQHPGLHGLNLTLILVANSGTGASRARCGTLNSRMRMSLRESRQILIDNLSFHLILQSMDGHVTSIAPNRPDS